jgi:hypothetical protein
MSVTLSESDLIKMYWWPFPPPEPELGWRYDFVALRHWFAGTPALAAERNVAVDDRSLWVAQATDAVITRAVALHRSAEALGAAAGTVLPANRSEIGAFVDNLVASPPIGELVPTPPPGGVVIVIPVPVPVPVPWNGEDLSGVDLLGAATRFQAAAEGVAQGPLREEFAAAAARLFTIGQERL